MARTVPRERRRPHVSASSVDTVSGPVTNRGRIGLVVALVALLAALVGAIGPATAVRAAYSWPPSAVPAQAPARLWYGPLLLARHSPATLDVRIPCVLPPALRNDGGPVTVLATARDPRAADALSVVADGDRLVVRVGDDALARVATPAVAGADRGCAREIRLDGHRWSITGGASELRGTLDSMPTVTGFFSALDLRSTPRPSIEVTTAVTATRTTVRQTLAWILAAIAVGAALLIVTPAGPLRRTRASVGVAFRKGRARAHRVDAAVATVLVAWWVIAPVEWDDGWIVARERTLASSGGLSTYYNAFGVNLPLDYWVEWLHHWIAVHSTSVLALRFPALVLLAAIWVLCRWALASFDGLGTRSSEAALWSMAGAFLVGGLAWDMAIRPEPVSAFLATCVLACMLRFVAYGSAMPLAITAVLVPLALTAHHTGIVSLAPVLAAAPHLVRWGRARLLDCATIVVASLAWIVTLAFLGSDLGQRLDDARITSEFGITQPWSEELTRYTLLDEFPWATPLRRASAALVALVLLAFARRRSRDRRPLDLSIMALAVALVLLVATPSKIPWHLGALTGILALAVAAEVTRFRQEARDSEGWSLRPFLVIGAALGVGAWVWAARLPWNPVDLRTLTWDSVATLAFLAVTLPALALGAAMVRSLRRGHRYGGSETPWRVATWMVALLAVPLVVVTTGAFAVDAVKTDGWTLARQNLESIAGRADCGLADDVVASEWRTAAALAPVEPGAAARQQLPGWVPGPPIAGLTRFQLSRQSPRAPWFELPRRTALGLFVAGSAVPSEALQVEWGRIRPSGVARVETEDIAGVEPRVASAPWTFVAASELPSPPAEANAVRIRLRASDVPPASFAVSAPVSYRSGRLSTVLRQRETTSLIHPSLLLYFPCARQANIVAGVAEAPTLFVWFDHPFQPHPFEPTSPFLGVRDLYSVQRLPLTDGPNPPAGVVVYDIDDRVPGALRVDAVRVDVRS